MCVKIGVIPARFGSMRFPGKVLAALGSKPVLQHVYERAKSVSELDDVMIATDDPRIQKAAEGFGAKVVMTALHHASGTDRLAEAIQSQPAGLVLNIQGDEPFIEPRCISDLVKMMIQDPKAEIGTVAVPLHRKKEYFESNVVKVVVDKYHYALYFSRCSIPYGYRECDADVKKAPVYRHLGVYAYQRDALERFVALGPSSLEKEESLEQLRALENGMRIKVLVGDYFSHAIDTPEDLREAEEIIQRLQG